MPFGEAQLFAALAHQDPNSYIELNGDHTRAHMLHRLIPETIDFRSVATFREPVQRVASLYSYTCDMLGIVPDNAAFDSWVRLVFCNRFNSLWRSHGLQTDIFFDDYGLQCVDRVYAMNRIPDLVDWLVPGAGGDLPHINQCKTKFHIGDLKLSTQRILLDMIAPDLEYWESLVSNGGMLKKP